MIENKLQQIARALGGWVIVSKGEERGAFAQALALVTQAMGEGREIANEEDPIFWFDKKGRLCTRAQTPKEIEDSMVLMAIAEGVSWDEVCQQAEEWEANMEKWNAFQEMKCKYMESLMRIQELEKELEHLRQMQNQSRNGCRMAAINQAKKLILMAMDLAGKREITKDELAHCLDLVPVAQKTSAEEN